MGKASRRHTSRRAAGASPRQSGAVGAPFVRRPFEGLPGEPDWVAMREILPAATAVVRWASGAAPEGAPATATVATVLPLAWPGLHRADGEVLISTQSGSVGGDPSRDLGGLLLATVAAPEGQPVVTSQPGGADTPRLQDLLDPGEPFEATLHEAFDFWVGDTELDAEGRASLERANESIVPTRRLAARPSAYWCLLGERAFVRWVLPHDEDAATDGLARLTAAQASRLDDDSRLLGAFRASGLLIPVWEVDPGQPAGTYDAPFASVAARLEESIASTAALTAGERRSRAGLLSRQVTLR